MTTDPRPTPAALDALFARWRTDGDAAALGRFFDATADDLFRVALVMTPDAATAEDAVQETFLAAIEHADRHDASRPAVPWLVGILRHKVEGLRRDRRRTPDVARVAARASTSPTEDVERAESDERVREAMERLPEPYRQVALMRWRYGLEPAEIAHLTGRRPGTVRVTLHRALDRLRARLRDGAVAALLPWMRRPRGLDAVRDTVLRRARWVNGATAAASLGGALVVTKTVVLSVVALAAVGAWLVSRGDGDVATPRPSSPTEVAATTTSRTTPPVASPEEKPPATVAVETPGPKIEGRVRDADGRPLGDVRIVAFPQRVDALVPLSDLLGPKGAGVAAVSTVDGAFRVPADPKERRFDVFAVKTGFAPTTFAGAAPGTPIDLTLARGTSIVGRVVDELGAPVAGARVRVARFLASVGVRQDLDAVADKDGAYRIAGLSAARNAEQHDADLDVRADGFAPMTMALAIAPSAGAETPLDITLFRGAPLVGTITDADSGAPIADAVVAYGPHATPVQGSLIGYRRVPHPFCEFGATRTAADGSFSFAHAPTDRASGGRLFVRAWKPGFTTETIDVRDHGEDGEMRTKIALWPSATLTGRVVDERGAPVPGARVRVTPGPPEWFPSPMGDRPWLGLAKSDSDGRYVYAGVRAGRVSPVELVATAQPGREITDRCYVLRGARTTAKARARAGETVSAPDIVFPVAETPPSAAFVVVGPDGRPVAGALLQSEGTMTYGGYSTDDAGRATLRWSTDPMRTSMLRGVKRGVTVSARGFARAAVSIQPSATSPPEVRVELGAPHRLAGNVREEDGRAVADAEVALLDGDGVALLDGDEARARLLSMVVSGRDGRFVMEDLPAGRFRLMARVYRDGDRAAREALVTDVAPDGPDVVATLARDDRRVGVLAGTVVDAETGAPVVGFDADVRSKPAGVVGRGLDAPAGRFRIAGVPEGEWDVVVRSTGRLAETVPVRIVGGETTTIAVRLARGVVVDGTVRGPQGADLARRRISLERVDADPAVGEVDVQQLVEIGADGSFRATGVRPGRYRAWVRPLMTHNATTLAGAAEVEIPAGGRFRGEFVVVATGAVEVTVEDPATPAPPTEHEEGAWRSPCWVAFSDADGRVVHVQRQICRGLRVQASLPAGEYVVALHVPGRPAREERVTVAVGATAKAAFGER